MKKQKGITLIALIITIIIMLILVGVTVTVSLNGGLFTTAKLGTEQTQIEKEKERLLMAVMGALGEDGKVDSGKLDSSLPEEFQKIGDGKYISSTENIFTVATNGTITLVGDSSASTTNPEEYDHNSPELHHSGTIPEGGRYVHEASNTFVTDENGNLKIDSTTYELTAGDLFPAKVYGTDYYYYGDYVYTTTPCVDQSGLANIQQSGWRFEVVDKSKSSYGKILESIAGINITSPFKAFYNCSYLNETPVLPKTATEVYRGVWNGTAISVIPEGVIPYGTTEIGSAAGTACFPNSLLSLYVPETVTNIHRPSPSELRYGGKHDDILSNKLYNISRRQNSN